MFLRALAGLIIVSTASLVSGIEVAAGARLILNEWNAVAGSELLNGGNSDSFFGRVRGNGDNWIELVVAEDHVDIRGWELRWWEDDGDGNGTSVWDPSRVSNNESQGKITFGDDLLWSNLRAGSILTISDKQLVNTSLEDGTPIQFDLSTDTSYDPLAGDFTIHVSSRDEADELSPLVTALSNIDGDPAGAFSVGKSDWEMTFFDGLADHFGPIGEAWGTFGGINDQEVGKLEVDPSPLVNLDDYNDGSTSTFGAPNAWDGGAATQDFSALRSQVPEPGAGVLLMGMLAWITASRKGDITDFRLAWRRKRIRPRPSR